MMLNELGGRRSIVSPPASYSPVSYDSLLAAACRLLSEVLLVPVLSFVHSRKYCLRRLVWAFVQQHKLIS